MLILNCSIFSGSACFSLICVTKKRVSGGSTDLQCGCCFSPMTEASLRHLGLPDLGRRYDELTNVKESEVEGATGLVFGFAGVIRVVQIRGHAIHRTRITPSVFRTGYGSTLTSQRTSDSTVLPSPTIHGTRLWRRADLRATAALGS